MGGKLEHVFRAFNCCIVVEKGTSGMTVNLGKWLGIRNASSGYSQKSKV